MPIFIAHARRTTISTKNCRPRPRKLLQAKRPLTACRQSCAGRRRKCRALKLDFSRPIQNGWKRKSSPKDCFTIRGRRRREERNSKLSFRKQRTGGLRQNRL